MSEIRFPYKKADINRLFPGKSIPMPDEERAARIEEIKKKIMGQVFMEKVCFGLESDEHLTISDAHPLWEAVLTSADNKDIYNWVVKNRYLTVRNARTNRIIVAMAVPYSKVPVILLNGNEQSLEYIGEMPLVELPQSSEVSNGESVSLPISLGDAPVYKCWRTTDTYTGTFNVLLDDKEIVIEEEEQR